MNDDVEILIRPNMGNQRYFSELWHYRELFYFLAWRDILVRYKQTAIGIAWSILRPLLTMVVFTVVFGKFANLPSNGVPYPVMVFVAMLPWQFFANSLSEGGNSLIDNANLLTKIYFPRVLIPASSIIVSLVDFVISFALLLAIMGWYHITPGPRLLILPCFIFMSLLASFGFVIWLAALNVQYRDFRYVIPFMIQFGLYISPVGFSSSIVPSAWRPFYFLNPMVGVIDGFRWSVLGDAFPIYWPGVIISLLFMTLVCIFGFFYFRNMERLFADVV